MEFPFTINSQDELNNLFKDRLAREAKKYEGFDTYKAKAEELDALKAQDLPGQLDKAAKSMADLQAKLDKATADAKAKADADAQSIADLTGKLAAAESTNTRTRIVLENGLPLDFADRLRGSTEDEWKADAEASAKFYVPHSKPAQPLGGNDPVQTGAEPKGHPFSGKITEAQRYAVLGTLADNLVQT